MKVHELITILQTLDQEAVVHRYDYQNGWAENWQTLEELDPTYRGYAWICFQNEYSGGKPWWPAKLCRIWTHQTSKTKWWTGWDLERNESLNLSWVPCKVIILNKPETP